MFGEAFDVLFGGDQTPTKVVLRGLTRFRVAVPVREGKLKAAITLKIYVAAEDRNGGLS
jgi:hypothetical protein